MEKPLQTEGLILVSNGVLISKANKVEKGVYSNRRPNTSIGPKLLNHTA